MLGGKHQDLCRNAGPKYCVYVKISANMKTFVLQNKDCRITLQLLGHYIVCPTDCALSALFMIPALVGQAQAFVASKLTLWHLSGVFTVSNFNVK